MNQNFPRWVQHWQQVVRNLRTSRELDALSPAERSHLAEDIGLHGTDLRRFNCTHDGPTKLMPARLSALGIDPGFVKHARTPTYRDMERVCATCKSSRQCAIDLARGDAQTGMESYCLNAPTIDALIVDWPVQAKA